MKVLVTGSNGQLGYDVINELSKSGHIVVGVDVQEMDVTDHDAVLTIICAEHPDAVIIAPHGRLWTWVKMMIKHRWYIA